MKACADFMLGNGDLVIYDTASRKEFKRVKIATERRHSNGSRW